MNEKHRKLAQGLLLALLFSFTAFLAAPLNVQITNQFEFIFTSAELFTALLPAFAICLVILASLLAMLQGTAYQRVLSIVFMLSLLLWLQGNILVWEYGALDGREIDWLGMWPFGLLDGALWLVGLGLAARYSGWMTKNLVGVASVFLILIQCVSLYSGYSNRADVDRYRMDSREKFAFSSQKNVIIIVVDAFQTDVFQELIDEDPALKDVFDGFVYFRNAVSGFRQSYPSVPNILTATYFDNSQPMWDYVREAYLSESSLPKFFTDRGYKSEVYAHKAGMYFDPVVVSNARLVSEFRKASPDILHNIDFTLFRYLPHFLKMQIYNNQLWLLSRWFPTSEPEAEIVSRKTGQDYIDLKDRPARQYFSQDAMDKLKNLRYTEMFVNHSSVSYEQPVFKYYHLQGIHLPIRMNRDFEYVEPERTREALKELSVGVIRLVGMILDSFREMGIFEDALIVLTADHGMWTEVAKVKIPDHIAALHGENGSFSRASLPERKGSALPLVLVKRIGAQGGMTINDAPVSLSDIPKTVVSETGFDASAFPGEAMFDLREGQARQRMVYFSTFKQNPSYSEPYRSTMTEFSVDGFSWLDQSWKKTGKIYAPPE